MARITIIRSIADKARERSNLKPEERSAVARLFDAVKPSKAITLDVAKTPLGFLKALLEEPRLEGQQRSVIAMRIFGMSGSLDTLEEAYGTSVATVMEFASLFCSLNGDMPNCEIFFHGRWYPISLVPEISRGHEDRSIVILKATLSICDAQENVWLPLTNTMFATESGELCERKVIEVLQMLDFRGLQVKPVDFNMKLLRAERWATCASRVALVTGSVLVKHDYWWCRALESRTLGSPEAPSKAIVEPELEIAESDRGYFSPSAHYQEGISRLPFVRLFSLELKDYIYIDVDDLAEYEFDESAMSRLHLPGEMIEVLSRVFNTPVDALFGDLIDGKHGGMVILACGGPGVGKTLTSEIYAEHTRRPLYVLELGELGTDLNTVEENLRRIFARVARWNAVLQFDECEIFLAARGEDLERSAIVGVFLRLLDYYRGILFLTTNRPRVLDSAVLSRVMLRLDYPDLDQPARAQIWQSMFEAADLKLEGEAYHELAAYDINGRQIRNLTRLARILHPNRILALKDMDKLINYTAVPIEAKQEQEDTRNMGESPRSLLLQNSEPSSVDPGLSNSMSSQ